MLCDPFGRRLVAGQSPKQGQRRVNFLVEVCDPSEDGQFAYTVNGVTVSDFYTPNFLDPVSAPGVRYSFSGAITSPRSILKGGYLSWGVPETNEWFQMVWFGTPKPTFRSLGVLTGKVTGSLRSTIDRLTPTPLETKPLGAKAASVVAAQKAYSMVGDASSGRADALREQIKSIKAAK
jgi:ABC-type amino acid transport substrate-binding protein